MTFICYVETRDCKVPHMEPLPVDTLEEARFHARRMLREQDRPVAAHIFRNDKRLDTLTLMPSALVTAPGAIGATPEAGRV